MPESVATVLGAAAPALQQWLLAAVTEQAAATIDAGSEDYRTSVDSIKADLAVIKADFAEIKADVAQLRSDLRVMDERVRNVESDISELRTDLRALRAEFADYRTTTEAGFERLSAQMLQSTRWSVGILALCGTMVTVLLAIQTLPIR